VGQLEALEAVARLGLLTDYVKNRVDELSTLGVVTLGPVVSGSGLAENEVVGAKELAERTGANRVHGSWLKIHKDSSGNITATSGLVEIHIDALQLKIGVSVVGAGRIDTVLVGDDLPELGTDLVTALASLNMDNFTHLG